MKFKAGDKLLGRVYHGTDCSDFSIEIALETANGYIAKYEYISGKYSGLGRHDWEVAKDDLEEFINRYKIAHSPLGKALE